MEKRKMHRTEYKVMTSWSMEKVEHRRVYEDEDGHKYIRESGEYKCIDDNKGLLGTMSMWT